MTFGNYLYTMDTKQKRLQHFIEKHLGMSISGFGDSIGLSHSAMDKYLKKKGDALPSDDMYQNIISKYNMLNEIWWLTGSGNITKGDQPVIKPKEDTSLTTQLLNILEKAESNTESVIKSNDKVVEALVEISKSLADKIREKL